MSRVAKVLVAVAVVLLLAIAGFLIWAYTPLGPMPEALAALESDAEVQVTRDRWLVFEPATQPAKDGLILYPGGRVDPRSYAPTARAIAASGYRVVIVPMPLNLAVLGVGRAEEVIAAFPEVERWAIGGHSLGGAMAASYSYSNPQATGGLALWAAYPASNNSLADRELPVTSISATLDGLATPDKINASKPFLPTNTQWVVIDGGNHAQFGWYGPQGGDNEATISREDQQTQVISATLGLLQRLAND